MTKESGFTLIELLTTIAIVGVLSANSVQMYSILRDKAYDTERDQLIRNAMIALEAGKGNFENSTTSWFWISSNANGLTTGWAWGPDGGGVLPAQSMLPGLNVRNDTRVNVSWDAECNANNMLWCAPNQLCCIAESYLAYHCKGKKVRNLVRWNNGQTMEWEWDNWGC